jgi:DNA ligase 4
MSITFNDICLLLEGVEKVSKQQPRLPIKEEKSAIHEETSKWFEYHRKALHHPNTSGSAVLSTIFPHRRKDRVYGLQAPGLSKKIPKLLNFGHGSLALFRNGASGPGRDLGVLTQQATEAWDGTFKTKHMIPIGDMDHLLIQLAAKYRFSDPKIRRQRDSDVNTDDKLTYFMTRMESWELKWFVRLLLRDYPTINLDEAYVFRQYHFLLPDLLKFQNDFDAAFRMLNEELHMYPPTPQASIQKQMQVEASQKLNPVVGVKISRPMFYKAWVCSHDMCLSMGC